MMLLTTNLQANSTDLSTMDNVIYVKPQSAEVGTKATLSFMMKNTAGIHDFQFDLYLPEGVTAVKDSKGRFIALLNSGRLPVDDEHRLTLSEEGDGAIRFQCSSLYDEVFTGNEGEILTMKVSIAETMTNGDYPIVLKNMRLCETDISKYYDVDYVETTLTVLAKNQTTTFTFEDSNNPFTDARRITSAIEDDATLGSKVLGWTCASNAQNGYSFSHYDFTSLLEKSAMVKLEFDYYNTMGGRSVLTIGDALVRGTTGGSSKITYNKTGAVFRIGSDKNNAYINDIVFGQDDLCNKWLHVVVTVNPDARTVAWVVTDQGGNEISSGSDNFYADDANACTQIDVFGYINDSHCAMMDNLTITNYKSNAAFADYTVRYVDPNGNEIKESRTGNGQVGKYAKLMDSDKEPVYANDYEGNPMKFVYESDNSETTPIAAEGTVITVTFREAEKYYAVLNCEAGGETIKQLRDDSKYWFFEGDNLTLYPSRGYSKDGKYYMTDATNNWNGVEYTFPGSISPTVIGGKTYYIGTLYYQLDESVAYYANFEDLALPVVDAGEGTGLGQLVGSVNNWWSFSNGYFERFSGGRGIRLDANSYVWTEPIAEDGTYMVRIYGRNDKSENCKEPYALGYRDAEGKVTLFDVAVPDWGSATTGESIVGSVEEASGIGIKAGWSLVIMNTGNGNMISLDDIKLTKVAPFIDVKDELVELPEGADVWLCTLEGIYATTDGKDYSQSFETQMAFVGNDIYIQGLSPSFPEAWIKGTFNGETGVATFPSGQYVGTDEEGPRYLVGSEYDIEEFDSPAPIVFNYEDDGIWNRTLSLQNPAVIECGASDGSKAYGYWMPMSVVYTLYPLVHYTVKYVDEEGNELKPARVGKFDADGYLYLYDLEIKGDLVPFFSEDGLKKYTFKSASFDDYIKISENEEENVITLTFNTLEACYATVNCLANGSYEKLATYEDIFFLDEILSIDLPLGLKGPDGKYYFTSPTSGTGGAGHEKFIVFPSGYTPTVRYGKTYYSAMVLYNEDPTVAYYADTETLVLPTEGNEFGKGLGQCDGGFEFLEYCYTYSLGHTIKLNEGAYLWTEPIAEAGTYQVNVFIDMYCKDEPFALGYRDIDGSCYLYTDLSIPRYDAKYVGYCTVEGVSIPAGASLIVMNEKPIYESTWLDDIKIVKAGEYTEPIIVGVDSPLVDTEEGAIYNLAGQRMSKMQKGINIVGGKKILVK